jgi:hypothetical protein
VRFAEVADPSGAQASAAEWDAARERWIAEMQAAWIASSLVDP